jgi:hypothetical protein
MGLDPRLCTTHKASSSRLEGKTRRDLLGRYGKAAFEVATEEQARCFVDLHAL